MAPRNRRNFKSSTASTTAIPPAEGIVSTRVGGNPYQFKGSGKAFEAKAVKEGLYLTVDMPGVKDNGVEVWMEETELFFSGEEQKGAEFETARVYGGCIDLGSDSGEISEMKIDMKNGVLRIILVGCTILPELSNLNVPSSSTRPSDPSQLEWRETKDGKRMIGFRNFSIWEYPDMPDVPSNKKILEFNDEVVLFGGDGAKWSEHDDEGCRGYFGSQRLQCGCCKYVDVQSEIKYGVLRMWLKKKEIKGRTSLFNRIANIALSGGFTKG